MTVRPILFSAPMVRAILAGTKTQTRRVFRIPDKKRPKLRGEWGAANIGGPGVTDSKGRKVRHLVCLCHGTTAECLASPYQVGDVLWVRESAYFAPDRVAYAADNEPLKKGERVEGFGRIRPGIHMPRWASRLTLVVTGVKVERLQDISKSDVLAEGCHERDGAPLADVVCGWHEPYAKLWDDINGAGAWAANPWVVAVTFEAHQQNVDAYLAATSNRAPALEAPL